MPRAPPGVLSNTFRSDRTFTPLAPARETASKFLYGSKGFGPNYTGSSWGRNEAHIPRVGDPAHDSKVKGHRHLSCAFEYLPEQVCKHQPYDITSLKRSLNRPHDHLVVDPQRVNIQDSAIRLEFPQQPVYYSHMSHKDIFPQHKPPTKRVAVRDEEGDQAEDSDGEYDVEPVLSFNREFKPDLRSSTKGSGWRTETLNSDWKPAPVPRPAEQRVSADTFNNHKQFARNLKTTHYSRTHGHAIKALENATPINKSLVDYKPDWKHQILKEFNEKHNEQLPDIRKPSEKKHVFYGFNTMNIEHG